MMTCRLRGLPSANSIGSADWYWSRPAGLRVPEGPMEDIFRIPPEQIPGMLVKMTVPTMVMWGNDDALIPVGQATAWAELVPDCELRLFDDAGHLLLDESPAAVGAVAGFCK